MKKRIKQIIGVIIGIIIGISTTVGATTIFNSKDITYSSDKTTKTNVKDSLDELYNKTGKCPEGQYCFGKSMPLSIVEIGDYISMTPTSTIYTVSKSLTGYTSDQTINPSELNLWRVIKKNENGTVEMISHYTSRVGIQIYGKIGYMNYIGILNKVAAAHTNDKYIQSTRHIGYSNQIEYCSEFSDTACPVDTGAETDVSLVENALGTLKAERVSGGNNSNNYYMISSRGYRTDDPWTGYDVRFVDISGRYTVTHSLQNQYNGTESLLDMVYRPILTIKSSVKIASGDGKSAETAYTLE